MKKYLTFKNGFILVCILLGLQTCSKCSTTRKSNYKELEYKNIIIEKDSLLSMKDSMINMLSIDYNIMKNDNDYLRSTIERLDASNKSLLRSNEDHARTIRKQTEIDYE